MNDSIWYTSKGLRADLWKSSWKSSMEWLVSIQKPGKTGKLIHFSTEAEGEDFLEDLGFEKDSRNS